MALDYNLLQCPAQILEFQDFVSAFAAYCRRLPGRFPAHLWRNPCHRFATWSSRGHQVSSHLSEGLFNSLANKQPLLDIGFLAPRALGLFLQREPSHSETLRQPPSHPRERFAGTVSRRHSGNIPATHQPVVANLLEPAELFHINQRLRSPPGYQTPTGRPHHPEGPAHFSRRTPIQTSPGAGDCVSIAYNAVDAES